ncbi:MAG: NAD(P)-dependent oxidoreductase [Deltaproteobacteria bacterium]|nr:NAD(P)-dependent oxidoreductase [Deltaproteobacteria bacterium]MBN2674677.1 NAD(P)-dependent oxidoreductase [Deltaproteobacteria bacterium]
MSKWLVTGGSGFLGINLIRELLKRGHEVVSLDLEPFTYEDVKDKIEHHVVDIRDRAKVDEHMSKGIDVFMHGAAALPLYKKNDILTTNVDGTRNVIDSAHAHGVSRGVYISSTAVYGIPEKHPLYETDPLVGVGPYGETKIKAEQIVRDYREKGMHITTIRPKSFIGPERLGVFAIFYQWASEGRSFPMIGRGRNLYQLLHVEDLCNAIILSAEHNNTEAINTEFNIGAKVFSTMREDYQVVLDKAGHGKQIKESPAHLVIFALEVLEFFRLSPLYPWVYKTATKDSFVSVEKAETQLGFTPKYSNKDALLTNYQWYLDNRHKFSGKSSDGVSHRVPWGQGILGLVRFFF